MVQKKWFDSVYVVIFFFKVELIFPPKEENQSCGREIRANCLEFVPPPHFQVWARKKKLLIFSRPEISFFVGFSR